MIETSREYGRGLLRGVTQFNREHGPWSIYFKPKGLGEHPSQWLETWNGDGILARISNQQMADAILKTKLPVIDLRGSISDLGLPPFGADNEIIAEVAYEHLAERGFHHFGICGEPPGIHRYDDERCALFHKMVIDSGKSCYNFEYKKNGRKTVNWEEEQKQITEWVKQLPKPVAIMTPHDDRGQQVLEACQQAGIYVPDEVAVLSVDNDEYLCNLSFPPLSSIDVNPERIGYEAAETLDRMMSEKTKNFEATIIPPRGVVTRQSTDVMAMKDQDIVKAVRYIRDHACSDITVDDVLDQLSISRSMFNRRFKKILGRSPKSEMIRVQIERARELLIDSDLPVQKIAESCGFQEPKYFIQVFHRRVGMTPLTFRRSSKRM
jgi:LacI family transcriptional regulator, galactose operon repressor